MTAAYRPFAKHPRAHARRMPPGQMNATEARYAQHLELRRLGGEILSVRFEAVTFKLGPDCRYTPDFELVRADGTIELHDVKGTTRRKKADGTRGEEAPWVEADAHVKIRWAASSMPWYRFCLAFERGTKGARIWSVVDVPAEGHAADAARAAVGAQS